MVVVQNRIPHTKYLLPVTLDPHSIKRSHDISAAVIYLCDG